ncbi:MAG TPA: VWA domain-containing protein [Thermoanaerobaculia bacterium]|nr:VWA domain-containing protein [Thermoanaerobaculia bacterium]
MKNITSLLLLALLGLPVEAADKTKASEPPAPEPTDLIETMTVSVVNVETYVTDKKGNRIKGLKREDFEILENGRPVTITNFSVMEGGKLIRPPGSEEEAPPESAPTVPGQPPPPPPVPEDQRLHLVVYIDNYNIQPFNRNRVLRELRDFLRNRLDEQDRVMLVTYDRELHVQRGWTTDPRAVAAQLIELETMTGAAVHRESDRRDALERIEEAESAESALSIVRTYAGSIYNDLNFSIDALRDLVNGLAGMPGRKAVLYVSEGLPQIAGQDLYYAVQEKFREQTSITTSFEFDTSRRFQELTNAANTNRVTFYTIDAGGLRTYGYGDASKQTAGQIGFLEQAYSTNLQAPLLQMAEATGGKAIINANRVTKDLDKIAEDFDTYYSLGYTPGHFGDGRYYKIEVKVKGRKDLLVRHREGYRDKPAVQRMNDGTMAALMHRFESNPLGLRLDFDPGQPSKDNLFLVPVKVSIPLSRVVMVPGDPSHRIRLKVYVVALDNEGGMSEIQEVPVLIDIPEAEAERAKTQWYLYTVQLLMRQGPHRVAVGLRDEVSGESSFITGQVAVGRR